MKNILLLISILLFSSVNGQLLKTEGTSIINSDTGEEVLLRGYGPGGWQIMEGYMMQTSGVAGSQHEIRENLVELMGEEKTQEFYEAWLNSHFTKSDVDSLGKWGFNSIRIPMHYNLFTLPIEEEPVPGENTWLDKGFALIDSVLKWSEPHGIYVILDMHATPGGQGTGSEINDYDPDKPSLWESEDNKAKLVALWRRIAETYSTNPWIGGYDLINETHWNLPGGTALRELYGRITDAIREVDRNHILFIEGNWYANDFTGLRTPWDANMVYSFHKYWSFNNPNDLDWILPLREETNVPLWMGESGENSNTWFTEAVQLFENNNIGWAWWALRKIGDIDSPYKVEINPGYQKILDYWKGEGPKPTAEETFTGMMALVENLKIENSRYRKDVIDALIRQPHTDETVPYRKHVIPGLIFLSDYDLGKNEFAYYDQDVADYNLSTGTFQAWNSGWAYRNDGADVEVNEDRINANGYHLAFTQKGEWAQYTVEVTEVGIYNADVRYATALTNAQFYLSVNGESITEIETVERTGDWQVFSTHTVNQIYLEPGIHTLKIHFPNNSVNVSSIKFSLFQDPDNESFNHLTAETSGNSNTSVFLTVNREISDASLSDITSSFSLRVNGARVLASDVVKVNDRTLRIDVNRYLLHSDAITLSYDGTTIQSTEGYTLLSFTNAKVINYLENRYVIPTRIEAENYTYQQGLQTESTTDTGGGSNIGYTDVGDFADYQILVPTSGDYLIEMRLAAQFKAGKMGFYLINEAGDEELLLEKETPVTGGWQKWQTIDDIISLPEGAHTIRMKVLSSGFNFNWFYIGDIPLNTNEQHQSASVSIYPNPSLGYVTLQAEPYSSYQLINVNGKVLDCGNMESSRKSFDLSGLPSGVYIYILQNENAGRVIHKRFVITK